MVRFFKDFEMAAVRCVELSERERKMKEREGVCEFRNLSTICISMSAIYMQMLACMSDRKAMSRARFSVTLP